MIMIDVRDALDLFMFSVPGCPTQLALRSLVDSAREFCNMTGVHQEPSDKLRVREKITQYEFDSPSNDLAILRLSGMSFSGKGVRNTFTMDKPANQGFLHGSLILGPAYSSKKLWSPLVESYSQAIVSGTLYRLLSMVGTEFYNPPQASMEGLIFNDWVHNARMEIEQPSRAEIPRGFY